MINYLVGDATNPIQTPYKARAILHICNDKGLWGSGFVMAISAKWTYPEYVYRNKQTHRLGEVQIVDVRDDGIYVVNMIAQSGIMSKINRKPFQPLALTECLARIKHTQSPMSTSIHMPRIGCGLGGGKWEEVEPIIKYYLADFDVYVYDLPSSKS